jgi:hypothetical protein
MTSFGLGVGMWSHHGGWIYVCRKRNGALFPDERILTVGAKLDKPGSPLMYQKGYI